mgnify:CR=1 FL=1
MDKEKWTAVDQYITTLLDPPDTALEETLRASAAAGLPEISVSPAHGALLTVLARAVGARRILEIGTLGGYSAIRLARALPPAGRLVTLDLNPLHAEVASSNIARAGLADRVAVRVGPATASLAALAEEGAAPFDFVFIDADKAGYTEYLQGALRLSRPGTLIVADNVVRQGRVIDPADDDTNVRGVRRFHDALAAEPRLMATVVQTVGVKGYDGLAIAVVMG